MRQHLNFWVFLRQSADPSPHVVRPLDQSSADVRFIAALLRSDREAAHEVLTRSCSPAWLGRFHQTVTAENLTAMVYDRLFALELAEPLSDSRISSGEALLAVLKREAAAASAVFTGLDERFGQLIDLVGEHIVWLKGPVMARTLYEKPYFRASRDFDLLVCPMQQETVFNRLQKQGFAPIWDVPGTCPRLGVGPIGTLENLAISPSSEFVVCDSLTLKQWGWPTIELKFDPLDNGLRMKEFERFIADCEQIDWQGRRFLAPSCLDHLLLQLIHLHKHGFVGWHWLYDIHLLVGKLAGNEALWSEFVRRCRHEQLSSSAWAGLSLVADRLASPVPSAVIEELYPAGPSWVVKFTMFTVTTEFIWNTATLPALLLNSLCLGDRERKLRVLGQTAFPSSEFLSAYYAGGRRVSPWMYPFVWLIHLLVLVLPGGLVRRTFGQFLWKYTPEK